MGTMTELIKHWKREGIAVAAGNTEAALAAFQRQNSVKLPTQPLSRFSSTTVL